ncbi:hypothetical protein DC31_09035 [Microbacterium sp. CH12i]|uniref:COG4315 family predicted lipoprotein n=1 Tax=Microbacterium sp. CH12i TaxID=1479651 RepID=UPI000461001D|nr:hypothetical protein [Microbacterium sp. CH12i]KDA06538.1 hypothetical protein DC31_09035 [Microbacterium sp. CH12i]
MNSKITMAVLGATLLLTFGLAGCASTAGDSTGGADPGYGGVQSSEAAPSEAAPSAGGASLATAESSLGEIVVDGEGLTVYMFDNDTQGAETSSCEGQCATNWPAVTTSGDMPELEGVSGEVGTITGVDGAMQVTLNGWPLYYYAGDGAPGDVMGQGINGVWWVLSPAGERMAQ